jgi:LysR family pca operon transcriptional activator
MRQIHCFVAVAQTGALQRAAEQLSISQPAVSKRLAELEELVGASLFTRGRQGARLTREGQRLLPFAIQMLASLRDGLQSIEGQGDVRRGIVRFGVLPTLAATLVPPALERLRDSWSHIQIHMETAANSVLLARVRDGQLSFAVNRDADPELSEGLHFEYLFSDLLVVVARPGHPVIRPGLRDAVSNGDFPVLVPPGGTLIRQSADRLLSESGMGMPRMMLETLSMSTCRALTLEGDAIWLVPRSAVARDVASNSLRIVLASSPGSEERVGITTLAGAALTSASTSLIGCVRQAVLSLLQ